MELQETVRLRDREQPEKKDRDREFSKRRRVDRSGVLQRSGGGGESYRENESTDSSDEEYYAEEEETINHPHNRMNQLSPTSSSLSNNRRGLRTLRSSPAARTAVDEMLGVHIPRRARSGMLSWSGLRNTWSICCFCFSNLIVIFCIFIFKFLQLLQRGCKSTGIQAVADLGMTWAAADFRRLRLWWVRLVPATVRLHLPVLQ